MERLLKLFSLLLSPNSELLVPNCNCSTKKQSLIISHINNNNMHISFHVESTENRVLQLL